MTNLIVFCKHIVSCKSAICQLWEKCCDWRMIDIMYMLYSWNDSMVLLSY